MELAQENFELCKRQKFVLEETITNKTQAYRSLEQEFKNNEFIVNKLKANNAQLQNDVSNAQMKIRLFKGISLGLGILVPMAFIYGSTR